MRKMDFIAEALENEAARKPASCKAEAEAFQRLAAKLRESNDSSIIVFSEEIS